ncbi:MAG TPA: hypothetical protein VK050_08500 [Flavobacteriaceae bacterium]|nr:hypothetical protein [Flavobacteriaceae bacterium]
MSVQKDSYIHRKMASAEMIEKQTQAQLLSQLLHENHGSYCDLPSQQSVLDHSLKKQLTRLIEVRQNELRVYPDDLPTSFVNAEKALVKYIAQCLQDVSPERRDTAHLQSLLREYKVLRFLPNQKISVSLEAVYSILQDNFSDSSICNLLNILLAGWGNLTTKTITTL